MASTNERAVRAFLRAERRTYGRLFLLLLLADVLSVLGLLRFGELTTPQRVPVLFALLLFGFATLRVFLLWLRALRGQVTVVGSGRVLKKSRFGAGTVAKTRSTRAYYLTVQAAGGAKECRCSQSTYMKVGEGSDVLLLTMDGKTVFAVER